jgi:hypothetical protein
MQNSVWQVLTPVGFTQNTWTKTGMTVLFECMPDASATSLLTVRCSIFFHFHFDHLLSIPDWPIREAARQGRF